MSEDQSSPIRSRRARAERPTSGTRRPPFGEEGDGGLRRFDAATDAAAEAYSDARRLVYDHTPNGPVDEASLSDEQLAALHRLQRAEHHLGELRHARHLRAPVPAPGPSGVRTP